jgi:hypothetical protein
MRASLSGNADRLVMNSMSSTSSDGTDIGPMWLTIVDAPSLLTTLKNVVCSSLASTSTVDVQRRESPRFVHFASAKNAVTRATVSAGDAVSAITSVFVRYLP